MCDMLLMSMSKERSWVTDAPDGNSRFCTDFRKLKLTVPDSYPLPLIDDLLDSIGQPPYVTAIDLLKGYYQIPLLEQAKSLSAFITPF